MLENLDLVDEHVDHFCLGSHYSHTFSHGNKTRLGSADQIDNDNVAFMTRRIVNCTNFNKPVRNFCRCHLLESELILILLECVGGQDEHRSSALSNVFMALLDSHSAEAKQDLNGLSSANDVL